MKPANPADAPLPALREDLQIMRGGTSYNGSPMWVVLDPVRNRFFRVTYEMFQLLSLWNQHRTLGNLLAALFQRYGRMTDETEIGAVTRMLDAHFFLVQPVTTTWRGLHDIAHHKHSWFMRLIHNYLFFKIPLIRPEPFIRATWPYVAFLFSRGFLALTGLVAVAGLYLVSRQWEEFVSTFSFVFSIEGAAISVVSIALIKSLHELGHAYVAHRHGCRIPTMGIAFMVMVPLLYTDVTDAWRLKSRKERLMIDSAGVITEICVGAFALFFWVFIPDGPARSAVFILAATGWILSLIVNTNPFMRFDGYYMMADLLNVENLQQRAFRHMRWRLRQLLFNTGDPAPEPFPPRLDAILTLYAVCTAIYRLLLYLGIALLVYHFTIKLVGILLFAVEIGFFILRPGWSELTEWWSMRETIVKSRRSYLTLAVVGVLITLSVLPLFTGVSAPGMMMPESFVRLYPREAGRLEEIHVRRGATVRQGDVLFTIAAPELVQQAAIAEIEIELAQRRLSRIGAAAQDLVERGVIQSQLSSLVARREGLRQRQEKLLVRAPFDGQIADVNPDISVGQWLSRKEQLAFLAGGQGTVVRGYVSGGDRRRIDVNASGWFVPDDLSLPRRRISLSSIALSGARQIDIPQLTSQFNGKIAVHPPEAGTGQRLVPIAAEYAVAAKVETDPLSANQTRRGVLLIDGEGESLVGRTWRQVIKVLVREAGA